MKNDNISSVVSTLYEIKAEFPHLRIAQIMNNFHAFVQIYFEKDTFYLSDEEFERLFAEYLSVLKSRSTKQTEEIK